MWGLIFFLILINPYCLLGREANKYNNDKIGCKPCQLLVRSFVEGLDQTQKLHFGGGNTDWEERNLGRFLTSEIRFVEVMEFVCRKSTDAYKNLDSDSDLQFKCQTLAEENEEILETWYFKFQEVQPNLEKYLCIEKLKKCCAEGYWGTECAPCPGLITSLDKPSPCFGKGTCNGDGTRMGTGKCSCDIGYVGKLCSNCDSNYFSVQQNSTYIQCQECFDGCASGCTAEGPKGCRACRTGYQKDEEAGCVDIDECILEENKEKKCSKANEICVNTAGSYYCDCANGFKRANNNEEECELDVEAQPNDPWIRADMGLRLFSIISLVVIAFFVLIYHPSSIAIFVTILAGLAAFLIERYYSEFFPDKTQN